MPLAYRAGYVRKKHQRPNASRRSAPRPTPPPVDGARRSTSDHPSTAGGSKEDLRRVISSPSTRRFAMCVEVRHLLLPQKLCETRSEEAMKKILLVCCSALVALTVGCASEEDGAAAGDDANLTEGANVCPPNERADISVFTDEAGKFRFRFVAGNGEIVLASSKGYDSRQEAESKLFEVQIEGHDERLYEIKERQDGEFMFTVVSAKDGSISAVSEGYATRSNAERAKTRIAQMINCMPKG